MQSKYCFHHLQTHEHDYDPVIHVQHTKRSKYPVKDFKAIDSETESFCSNTPASPCSLQGVFTFLAEHARRQIIVSVIKGNFIIDGSLQSKVLVTAFGLAAEIEREFISLRTKEALAIKKREGQALGRPIIGHKNTKTKLSRHEEMTNNYLKLGLSAPTIANLIKAHPETIQRYARSES
jgi:DNA invertase Pin-like site-specific DNA recombinase